MLSINFGVFQACKFIGLSPHMPPRTMDPGKLAYLVVRIADGRVVTSHMRVVEGLPEVRSPQAGVLPGLCEIPDLSVDENVQLRAAANGTVLLVTQPKTHPPQADGVSIRQEII